MIIPPGVRCAAELCQCAVGGGGFVQIQDGGRDSVGKQERATPPPAAGDEKLFSAPFSEVLGSGRSFYSISGDFVFWLSW